MPPYLGESVKSVTDYLASLDLSQFNDPFRMDDIHEYLDSVAPDNRAAKASVDIALHDLVGKRGINCGDCRPKKLLTPLLQ